MIFSERRLAVILSVFMLSVFFLCVSEYKFITAAAVISIVLTAVLIILRFVFAKSDKNKLKSICVFLPALFIPVIIAAFFCILNFNISEKPVLKLADRYEDTPVYIKGEIKNVSSSNFFSIFDLKVFEVNGEKTKKFNLSLMIYGEVQADETDIDSILETYVTLRKLENGNESDASIAYYKSGGYYIGADNADDVDDDENSATVKITTVKSHSLTYYLNAMRSYTQNTFFKNIKFDYHDKTTQEAAVAFGIFTGNKSKIDSTVKTDFKKSGISHVLAVSGLHLSILCGLILSFLNFLKVHKKITCVIIILCCLFFIAFTGFSVSVTRAGIMLILYYSAFLMGRKSDSMTSLLAAGTFITLLNPYNILNTGFQLSFTATMGIITATNLNIKIISRLNNIKKLKVLTKLLKAITASFIATTAATVFTLPFISYNFKTISLISPITNLLAAPLITAILFLSLCIMIFSFIPVILGIFSLPVYFITKLLINIANYLGRFKYAYISVESTNGTGFYIFAVIFLVLIILCFLIPKISAKKLIKFSVYFMAALAFLIMSGSLVHPRIIFKDSLRIAYYSDDKNQNIILFQKDYDYVDIIDITHGTQSHIKPVYDIILENGAIRINSVILSDYRKRHVQMIKKYITYSEINKVCIPEPLDDYDIEVLNMLYYLSLSGDFELIKYNNSLKLDDVLITVNNFDYNKMRHMTVELDCTTETMRKKLLYLGIGYKDGYAEYTDINNKSYDIVFYGSHKHNRRDDDYISNIYGSYAGVLSGYIDGDKNKASQKLDMNALEAYLSGSLLLRSDDYGSVVFEVNKDEIKYYLK
ncbi:MAG: ComEC/Rec2 family competence protein [Oscillospiraceae bacterium]|nr:ComEC/Rec2 family competence protein [Oscillospiraceae bacterium]